MAEEYLVKIDKEDSVKMYKNSYDSKRVSQ